MNNLQMNGLDARAIQVDATASGANTALTVTMPAVVGYINVLLGYDISGTGATAASTISVVSTGLAVNLAHQLAVPAGASTAAATPSWHVRPPVGRPASASNTAVSVTVPAFGTGNLGATINLYGYRVPG